MLHSLKYIRTARIGINVLTTITRQALDGNPLVCLSHVRRFSVTGDIFPLLPLQGAPICARLVVRKNQPLSVFRVESHINI